MPKYVRHGPHERWHVAEPHQDRAAATQCLAALNAPYWPEAKNTLYPDEVVCNDCVEVLAAAYERAPRLWGGVYESFAGPPDLAAERVAEMYGPMDESPHEFVLGDAGPSICCYYRGGSQYACGLPPSEHPRVAAAPRRTT